MEFYSLCRNYKQTKCPLAISCLRAKESDDKKQSLVNGDYYANDCRLYVENKTLQESRNDDFDELKQSYKDLQQ